MCKKSVELKVCSDNLGLNINSDEFESKLIFQKTIYLLQELGLDLGYGFKWYLRGPYSSSLTDISHEINSGEHKQKIEELCNKAELTENARLKINNYKTFISESNKPEDLSDASWIELLASLHYINKYTYQKEKGKRQLLSLLKSKKEWYSEVDIEQAIDILVNNNLITFNESFFVTNAL